VSKPSLTHLCLIVVAAGTVASAQDLDKAKLDQARSVIAEAALLETAAARGRVTQTYAQALRDTLREDLQKLARSPQFAATAHAALTALDRHDAAALAGLRDRLVARERSHGRAD